MRQHLFLISLVFFLGIGNFATLDAQERYSKEWRKIEKEKRKFEKKREKEQRKLARQARKEASKRRPDKRSSTRYSKTKSAPKVKVSSRNNFVQEALKYRGTPYRYGGESPSKGFDCSGYVQYVFQRKGIQLPRTAAEQARQGVSINKSKLESGDLVFFGSGAKIDHVGIVVSKKGEELMMIHSGSSTGVTLTNIENSAYWKKRLKKGRRIK